MPLFEASFLIVISSAGIVVSCLDIGFGTRVDSGAVVGEVTGVGVVIGSAGFGDIGATEGTGFGAIGVGAIVGNGGVGDGTNLTG